MPNWITKKQYKTMKVKEGVEVPIYTFKFFNKKTLEMAAITGIAELAIFMYGEFMTFENLPPTGPYSPQNILAKTPWEIDEMMDGFPENCRRAYRRWAMREEVKQYEVYSARYWKNQAELTEKLIEILGD